MAARGRPAANAGTVIGTDFAEDVYRRVVEVHYALMEATIVDPELHHWAERRLEDLLAVLEPHITGAPAKG